MSTIKSNFLWFFIGFLAALILIGSKNSLFVSSDNELALSVVEKRDNAFNLSTSSSATDLAIEQHTCVGCKKVIETAAKDEFVSEAIPDEPVLKNSRTKESLIKLAEYLGIESYSDLDTFQQEEIVAVIEQQLMLDFYINEGDIIERFDGIEHYLDEQAAFASPRFLSELLDATSSQDEDSHSYALYTIGNAFKHFEDDEGRSSDVIRLLTESKSSESELVRLTVLQSLSELISDDKRLLREIRFFENDASDIVKAKFNLLRYQLE